ncbi:MAG TPA: Dabb family protein [Anaerolineales bacterium]|nr:Dabb family protein [Anaerolineales bacterium]
MLTHIVLFKLKDPSAAPEVKRRLEELPAQIPQIRHFEIGLDIVQEARSFHVSVFSRFDSLESLREYQSHPAHVAFGAWLRPQIEAGAAVDY